MAKQDSAALAWKLASVVAAAQSEGDAAGAVARSAATLTGAESVHVWLIDHVQGYRFAGAWPRVEQAPESPPANLPRTVAFGTVSVGEDDGGFRSQLILPLARGTRPMGGIVLRESARERGPFTQDDLKALERLLAAADEVLPAIRDRFKKQARQAETVVRLTRLFDLGRSLTAAADMETLQSLLVDRVRISLEVVCAYLWRPSENEEGKIAVVAAAGPVTESVEGWQLEAGAGLAGQVFETGEAVLIPDPDEIPDLEERPDAQAGLEIYSVAAAPLLSDEGEVQGVLEVVNADGDDPYMEGSHLAFLEEVTRTGVVALGNALRLEAEKRAGDLGSLLEAVQAVSETLDVDRIAFTLVHQAASVIPYKRAAVGLYKGTKLELRAVSGQTTVDEKLPEIRRLSEMLRWAAGLDEGLYVVQEDDGSIETARPESKEKFRAYFEETGVRSFLTVPLKDDEGKLGVFAVEADSAYAFAGREIEVVELLTATTTTAVRNATLYQAMPKVFEPISRIKEKVRGTPLWKRLAWSAGLLAAAVILFLVPVPLRVAGEARILPEVRRPVVAEVEGRVARVLVREGDAVDTGQVVAALDDADYRAGEDDARARYEMATTEQSRLRADGDTARAAIEQARVEGLKAEMDLWRSRVDRTLIRSPLSGIVATPRVDELAGSKLEKGKVLCEVVDPNRQQVEIAVLEQDAGLIDKGMLAKLKLRAYPTHSYRAVVERIGVAATQVAGNRVFLVRARLLDAPELLRSGMTGEAKITTGPASIAHVVLRRPGRWLWGLIWGWLP
ncbi:MAG TPA: GAF domain-containing protein [Candidatus Saccharimonadales bacterium]|nr:GAF domain-containing protein [Candidatus Saccharimonadales bacterium]